MLIQNCFHFHLRLLARKFHPSLDISSLSTRQQPHTISCCVRLPPASNLKKLNKAKVDLKSRNSGFSVFSYEKNSAGMLCLMGKKLQDSSCRGMKKIPFLR